jgi:hypothetical protein
MSTSFSGVDNDRDGGKAHYDTFHDADEEGLSPHHAADAEPKLPPFSWKKL